ncbi:four helix bundle protein [Opitutus terrae]|uniref:S23 ribosomal protein n=1 Tax=Opitutus terrae (strain DSM 11246 / JCM 15787 / PB90-1) TaxID=452637 RepID=B1ZYD8_OPITP|nr:four helix bundle protein [Opitutus terrae]ACB77036.1 S23 ribosomal protein [Opitutus terrae PB90-1]
MKAHYVQELDVYREAFHLQQEIFAVSQKWPKEETYSLIDQVRRSSRSVGANLSEAWAKRRYPAHFLSKLTEADGELSETRHWIATAQACRYLQDKISAALSSDADRVGKLLGAMIQKHTLFCLPSAV